MTRITLHVAGLIWIASCAVPHAHWGRPDVITDWMVEQSLSKDLAETHDVRVEEVDVRVEDGVVTLTGSVDNLLANRMIVERSKRHRGVRAVVDRIAVHPRKRMDSAVLRDVRAALVYDPATEAAEIRADVEGGVVTLAGEVQSNAERLLAEQAASGVLGVRKVRNMIRLVRIPERSDAEIREDVEGLLTASVWIREDGIEIEVREGTVSASGVVGSADQKGRLFTICWVAGARGVNVDDVKVDWRVRDPDHRRLQSAFRGDTEVKMTVLAAFRQDPRIKTTMPTVRVSHGIVTLTGKVYDLAAKAAAENDAKNTVGVWRVRNHIRVRPAKDVSDEEVAASIRLALKRDAVLSEHLLEVAVKDGLVRLRGEVDSLHEKRRAGDVAAGARGAVNIWNRIRIGGFRPPKDDVRLRRDVQEALWRDPYVSSATIDVKVKEGIVTLSGTVDLWFERVIAERRAKSAGARRVLNRVQARYGPPIFRPVD